MTSRVVRLESGPFRASHVPGEEVNKRLVRVVATDLSRVLLKSLFSPLLSRPHLQG